MATAACSARTAPTSALLCNNRVHAARRPARPPQTDSPQLHCAIMLCPACDKADLTAITLKLEAPEPGKTIVLRAMQCPACGEGIIEDHELRHAVGEPRPHELAGEIPQA
ncbi:YgiT-type zinc finger protein [Cupriavidus sp. TMH.W2]|uniref:YgiT-type zinc finger protein n=1 Tax=Cupriavidus sp. TMH.W2 TaxID=3434465 RepID=UPI003D76F3AB